MIDETGPLTIGALAKAASVNVETIRFYQRKALMREPARAAGSVRRYGAEDVLRVAFIKAAQRLGFSLDEIGELLALDDGSSCSKARVRAQEKLNEVKTRLRDLHRIERVLTDLVSRCDQARGTVRCPLIEALQEPASAG